MAEKEYIDREAAILALLDKGQRSKRYHLGDVWELNFDEIKEAIASIPAADVRPVVLCRDCKHGQGEKMDFWNEYEGIECIGGVVHRKDWFCADGEKKDET